MPSAPDLIVRAAAAFGVPGAGAVAVTNGRISAIGDARSVTTLHGPRTRVVDVPGGLVCPGFHDAHAHLVPLARARLETELHGLDLRGIADAVRRAAARTPPGRWLVGRGFDPEVFRLAGTTARALLDEAAGNAFVLLRSHDHHSVAMNTAAMIRTGYLPRVPVTTGGRVDRDADGAPTGIVGEMDAMAASAQAEDLTEGELADAVAAAIPELHRAGLVALHDMSGTRPHAVLRALDAARRLAIDVFATVSPGDAGKADLVAPGHALCVSGMKMFLDGALGSRTAHLLEPYEGDACHKGVEVVPRDEARRIVAETAAAGLPSFLHAIGDAAVRSALDALEGARGPNGEALRHRVEHAQMIHDDDLPRFAAGGIVASMQPVHMALDAPIVHRHWGARAREAFPMRRLLDSRAIVAFGSDAPIETFDTMAAIRCAVSRRGTDGTPLSPEEAITPAEAISAYTLGAAQAVGAEREAGALAVGRVASLTVLSRDVAAHPESLADCAIAATVVHGDVVFERSR
jgi:predicted amidohydrolase YtcJ